MHACFFCETRYELLGIVLHSLRITGYYYLSHWLGDTKCYSNNYEMFTLWDQHNLWKPGKNKSQKWNKKTSDIREARYFCLTEIVLCGSTTATAAAGFFATFDKAGMTTRNTTLCSPSSQCDMLQIATGTQVVI